jgi:hypothetical protein
MASTLAIVSGGGLAGQSGLVPQQARDPLFRKALLPAPDRRAAHPRAPGNLQHGQALVGVEDDAGPLDMLVRTLALGDDGGKALAVSGGENDARDLGHALRLAPIAAPVNPQNASVH